MALDERNQFKSKVSCRASWGVLDKIKTRLKGNAMIAFKNSCFGHFMSVEKIQFQGQLYLHLLLRQDTTNSTEKIVYHINGHESVFGSEEFCLITGLNFGNLPSCPTTSDFHKKIFDGRPTIHVSDIEYAFDRVCDEYNGDSAWCLKVALLYFLQGILVARDKSKVKIDLLHLHMLDDLNKFNVHPWGRVVFDYLMLDVRKFQGRFEGYEKRKKEHREESFKANGFPYAIQVWAYEMMPAIGEKYGAPILDKTQVFPRLLRYKALETPSFDVLKEQFFPTFMIGDMTSSHIKVHAQMKPTSEEKKLPWYINFEACRTEVKQSEIQNMSDKRTRDNEESDEEAIRRESRSKRREEPSRASENIEIQDGGEMTEQIKNLEKRMTKMVDERMSKVEERLEKKMDKVIDGLQMVLQEMKRQQSDSKSDHPETNRDQNNEPSRSISDLRLSHLIQCPALDYLLPLLQVQHSTLHLQNHHH